MLREIALVLSVVSSLLALPAGCSRCPTRDVAATIGADTITVGDVDRAAGPELQALRARVLERLIEDRVLGEAARKRGVTAAQLLDEKVRAAVPEATEEEARAFFERNQANMGPAFAGKPFEQVRDDVRRGITEPRRRAARAEIIAKLREQAGVSVRLKPEPARQ